MDALILNFYYHDKLSYCDHLLVQSISHITSDHYPTGSTIHENKSQKIFKKKN